MKKSFKYYKLITVFGLALLLLFSCGGGNEDDPIIEQVPEKVVPSNLTLSITLEGVNENNPEGDGSGIIKCVANATDAISYEFRFGNGDTVTNSTGTVEYTYSQRSTNSYSVYVYAYSKTGDFINSFQQIKVYVARPEFKDLVFSDEFDTDGSPDDSKWGYDIGRGDNGWGNGEKQYYTNRSENVIIEEGMLKITAKRENYEGAEYTSTRMLTEGKFDFTYGKVEVRAKLPIGEGTWPAIWMLGSNIRTAGWPACGEIDIMEHWGHNHGNVQSAMHTPSSFGNTTNHGAQYLADVSTQFHVYVVEWDDQEIVFSVDGKEHYKYSPALKNSETWPYTANQFLILNVAMGGSWFSIDPNFVASTLEIDYVRVYQ
ncbi:glycoside hydrolase family 16 protein [Lutibacter flavus]|uniref:Glycosyl hydrolases family 16 n=1 Tax=Lutibacter flavus TaxID=691689 RepID=A0A238YED5_9FLAO|nr:glycoside hydrolase family 16 protein [Lutibacter flavus]SNR69646.1 Glycosyl hydrolases family 16 [Lutibacter flavus]